VKLRSIPVSAAFILDHATKQEGPKEPIDIKHFPMAASTEVMSQESQPMMHRPSEPMQTSFEHGMPPMSIAIPPTPMVPLTTAAILSQRRRKKSAASLKRSASTPNVRGHHNSDAGMTSAEKRRNKLGYHRTSVACGMKILLLLCVIVADLATKVIAEGARSDACLLQMIRKTDAPTAYD